jgi:hypothetical protein
VVFSSANPCWFSCNNFFGTVIHKKNGAFLLWDFTWSKGSSCFFLSKWKILEDNAHRIIAQAHIYLFSLVLGETNSHANSSPSCCESLCTWVCCFVWKEWKNLVHSEFLPYFARNVFTKINVQISQKKCGPNYVHFDVMKFSSKVLQSRMHMWSCKKA